MAGCVPCGANKGKTYVYDWSNGSQSQTYNSEVEAQARKNRDGGSYTPRAK